MTEFDDLPIDHELTEEQAQRFRIDGDRTAQWAMRRLADLRAEEARDAATYDAEVDKLKDWANRRHKSREWDLSFFERHLEDYARRQRAETGRKTVDLPSGVVRTTERKARVIVDDDAAFIAWAQANDRLDLLRLSTAVDKAAVGKATKPTADGLVVVVETGEAPDGLVVEPAGIGVTVKPGMVEPS